MAGAFDAAPDGTASPDVVSEPVIERPAVPPAASNAAMDQQQQPAASAAAESRRVAIPRELITNGKLTADEHAAKTAELKRLVAQEDTPAEREALVESGVVGARDLYGFDVPDDVPKYAHGEYAEQYAGHDRICSSGPAAKVSPPTRSRTSATTASSSASASKASG